MGRKDVEKNIVSSKRKSCMENPHRSRVDDSLQRIRYCLQNQEREIKMFKTCGKNVRRKNYEAGV